MKINNPSHFSTFCTTQNLKLIRDFVSSNLSVEDIDEVQQQMIVLAVDEICANSILHANQENSDYCIDVFLQYDEGEVVVEIVDKGDCFEYDAYKEPNLEDLILKKDKGSMGLMLVRKIMDKIDYMRVHDMNICRMVKKVATA